MLCWNNNCYDDSLGLPKRIDMNEHGLNTVIKWKNGEMKLRDLDKNIFRYSEPQYEKWMEKWLHVYENQYTCANEIIEYIDCGFKKIILAAEMQSGKTGTVRYLSHILQMGPLMDSSDIYFICGMNDNDLYSQSLKEFENIIPKKNILFSSHLQKINREKTPLKCKLLIIDESHYAGKINSQIDQFISKIEGEYITVSVSATPMAELASAYWAEVEVGKVYLRPGKGYYGIKDLFDNNRIFQSINITTNQSKFIDLISSIYESGKMSKKYNIVRIPSIWYKQDLEEDILELDMDVRFIDCHSTSRITKDFNEIIAKKPKKFTIVWIYGSLRAGKQLNTKNIGFVHDTSSANADTVAQGLLGRILGYNKKSHGVVCYTDINAAENVSEWFSSVFDLVKIPGRSKYVIGGYRKGSVDKWVSHPPYCTVFSRDQASTYRSMKQRYGNRYPYKYNLIEDFIDSVDGTIKEEVQKILSEYMPGPNGGVMILTEENSGRSYREHWIGNFKKFIEKSPAGGFNTYQLPAGKYFYIFVNLNIYSPCYGYGLLIYKEYNYSSSDSKFYAKTNKKSRFYQESKKAAKKSYT